MIRKTLVAAVALAVVAVAAPAGAHVTVNPKEATKGSFAKLAFRVPTERPDAGTTKVEVSFPVDHPFEHLNVRPAPGWTYKIDRQTLATPIKGEEGEEDITEYISKITWEGGKISPGEFQEFEISGGPLPEDADQLVFKAVQTYDSGEVVRWIEEATAGGAEPDFPAPVLTLVAGGDAHGGGHGSTTEEAIDDPEAETPDEPTEQAGSATNGGDDRDDGLAAFALVVAGVALVLSGGGLIRKRGPEAAKD